MRARSVGAGFAWRQSAIALALAACGLSPDYDGTSFRCPPTARRCPDGYTCVADRCVPLAADAPPGPDAPPDAPVDVCARAAVAPDNDRCADAIDITGAASAPAGATLYGDTTGYAADLNPAIIATCTGAPTPGPDAIYRLDAAAGATVELELTPVDWDGAIYLLDACTTSATCLGGHDDLAVGTIETRSISIATAGTYYVIVDSRLTNATGRGCFTLRVRL